MNRPYDSSAFDPLAEPEAVVLAHAPPLALAELTVEPGLLRLTRDGAECFIEPLVMRVLVALARADGAILTRDELVEQCWSQRIVGDDAIARVIGKLRKLAADFAGDAFAIETITKVGYRLLTRDRPVDAPRFVAPAAGAPPFTRRRWLQLTLAGGALAGAGAAAWRFAPMTRPGVAGEGESIAIMPFANIGDDRTQDYFADGVTEELRGRLARLARLQIAARASSAAAQKLGLDAPALGKKLRVRYVIDGSVRRLGQAVRVSATLVDTRTGFESWTQTYDRQAGDIFAIQDEIAQSVAREVIGRLDQGETALLARAGTIVPAAFDAYAQGRALFDLSADEPTYRAALAAFDRAIALDPAYAQAWAQRARVVAVLGLQFARVEQLHITHDDALRSARRAVALGPRMADTHAALAYVQANATLDFAGAAKSYERAYAYGANNADILIPYGSFAVRTGRGAAALTALQRALALDPLNPRSHYVLGYILVGLRRYEAALPHLRDALALSPAMSTTHGTTGVALLMLGRVAEAREEYLREPAVYMQLSGLAITEHKLGRPAAARDALARLNANSGDAVAYQRAQIYAQWGDPDRAFAEFETAVRIRDAGLASLRNDPLLDPLRGDARFARLVARLGLPG
ncbi:MAG: winged helix-turn-helix domain-containing tetratricopeptide repeat protein [Novosphingobium sp.]